MNPSHSGAFSVTGYEFHFKCADVSILKLPAKAQECIPQYLTCTDPKCSIVLQHQTTVNKTTNMGLVITTVSFVCGFFPKLYDLTVKLCQ